VGQSRRFERTDWPLAASAQQSERMRRIGVLMNLTADDPEGQARLAAFLQGLQELGWTDGRNVRIAPYLAAAARSGLSLVWKIVLIGELLGRANGVGFEIGVAWPPDVFPRRRHLESRDRVQREIPKPNALTVLGHNGGTHESEYDRCKQPTAHPCLPQVHALVT
jgi:hypothetical protein